MTGGTRPGRVYQGYPRMGEAPSADNPYPTMADGMRALEELGRQTGSGQGPSATTAGLRGPLSAQRSPTPAPQTPGASLARRDRFNNEMLGFLEGATAPAVRLDQLVEQADPRHLSLLIPGVTGTQILGAAAQKGISHMREQGYLPGGGGKILGNINAAVQYGPLGPANLLLDQVLGKEAGSLEGQFIDGLASSVRRAEDRLPGWMNLNPAFRPPKRRR